MGAMPHALAWFRPGRRVRLRTVTDLGDAVLYSGKVANAKVTYDLKRAKASNRARIDLTAVDNVSVLAQQKRGAALRVEIP